MSRLPWHVRAYERMYGVCPSLHRPPYAVVVDGQMPVAGVDYPRTYQQFREWFPDDAACASYLEQLRWKNGFVCPGCGAKGSWRAGNGTLVCQACHRRTSVTAGTIFHGSRQALTTWFAAVWFVTSQKNGVPALGLQRALGLGSYKTAWAMLHKLRRAMVRPDRDQLSGLVEVDEAYVGGVERGVDGRHTDGKAIVIIAVEIAEPHGLGRVRMKPLRAITQDELLGFVNRSVEKGSRVRTDGWNIYQPLTALGYEHEAINIKASGGPAHVVMPGVHRVASLVKRWLAGTLHYGISHDHLAYYLDEFTFRFNRRQSAHRGLLFYRLLEQSVEIDPRPYKELVGGVANPYI